MPPCPEPGLRVPVLVFLIALALASGPVSNAAGDSIPVPPTVMVPAGPFIMGSGRPDREAAYVLDETTYGHSRTRKWRWYEKEGDRRTITLPAFAITTTPITNTQYAAFIRDTGHRPPDVGTKTWAGYKLIHPYERTRRHAWTGGKIPAGRGDHPVVLVSHGDARAYAEWLSRRTGQRWRLPREREWEKAARGPKGRRFPWGNDFDPALLNSHDRGPFDTLPVGRFPEGASPFGLLDAAGQVFEWMSTADGPGRYIVKGGSWDDRGCGICRPAARHSRPARLKHILIGFRLVRDP